MFYNSENNFYRTGKWTPSQNAIARRHLWLRKRTRYCCCLQNLNDNHKFFNFSTRKSPNIMPIIDIS